MKKRPIFFVLLLSFLFISCENLLSPKDSYNNCDRKTYTITGDINIEGALPKELFNENSTNSVARTGFPTVPNISDSELNLYVFATNADSSSTIEGTINAEKTQYSINLPKGQWTITVSGKKSDVVILEGSVTVELNDEYVVLNSETIILKPVKNTGGKGNLSLKLALDIGSFNCGGVKATLSSSEDPKTKYILFTDSEGNPASEIDLEFSDISSGTYSFNLEFYDRMNFDDAASDYVCENIIYILNDTVNIFDGLTTNEWSGTGYSEDKTTFSLTQEMIANFAMTTFYVDADYGNDDNEGTFFAPKMSINKVLEKIDTINDGTSEYRIYIKGNINNTSENSSFINNSFINITPTNTLNLLICGFGNEKSKINAERNESQTGRVMYIGENANVTLQNLILTGGYLTNDENGAGLYILNNDANVIIENSEISENVIENGYGAGLRVGYHLVDERLNLTIENSKISRNTIKHDSNGALSQAGAGIDIENVAVALTITNSDISENVIDQNNCSSVVFNDYGVGLCLGNRATTIISGTAIKNNKIENAASTNENAGGGVYLYGGTLKIQNSTEDNTVISGNSSTIGGGVATAGSFFMSGGTISENIVTNSSDGSKGNGSAVAVLTDGLFTVSENITINGDVYLYENQTITVSNNFVGGEVMITPYMYESSGGDGVQVLKPIAGESLTTEIVRKFEVTPQVLNSGGYEYWHVKADGMLAKDSIIYVKSDALADGNGTLDNPFITIQEAVNKAINDSTARSTKFKILLQSNVEDTSTDSYTNDDNFSLINIDPINDLTLEIASYGENSFKINAKKSGANSGRVMYIGQKANVTLRNINISGGNLTDGNGGAIYCSGTLNLVNSTISESNAKNGGGIYIENGTFTMNGGIIGNEILEDDDTKYSWEYAATTIGGSYYSNFASSAGGGIYAKNATVNIISGKVSYNYAINYESAGTNLGIGGGIFMKNGTLTIGEGAEVSYNSGYQGAGIRCESETLGEGTCTIKEGAIIKGNATHIYNKTNYGGGIFVKKSNFIMEGGTIEENYAGDGGAGIHLENVSPTITKGNIRNNKYGTETDAHKFGSEILLYDNAKLSISSSNVVIESFEDETRGIYVRNSGSQSELALSDSAYIKSPVYLDANANIKITGALTTPEEANGIIATITPNEYSTTRQVLVAGSGVTLSNSLVKQFNVIPAEDDKEWFVDSYGYLGKVPETETNDEGTDVYLMESYDNLLWIAQELRTNGINSFNIKLTNDIEIPSGKWTSPLDVTKASTIDGQGHSIKFNDGSGLFERFHGGLIENLVLEGTINTSSYKNHHNGQCGVGVLAGSTYKTTIRNVVSTVDVVDTGDGYVGGLIGYFGGNSNMDGKQPGSFIQNCAVYANVTSTNGTVGGLVGGTWSGTQCWQINNCIYKGNVTGGPDQGVGAIIGTHNTGRKSTFKDTWYCANGTSEIVGKYNNQGNGVNFNGYDTVISKTTADIATAEAATLLNTNSDGTVNAVWEYVPGSDYPTLKTLSSE